VEVDARTGCGAGMGTRIRIGIAIGTGLETVADHNFTFA